MSDVSRQTTVLFQGNEDFCNAGGFWDNLFKLYCKPEIPHNRANEFLWMISCRVIWTVPHATWLTGKIITYLEICVTTIWYHSSMKIFKEWLCYFVIGQQKLDSKRRTIISWRGGGGKFCNKKFLHSRGSYGEKSSKCFLLSRSCVWLRKKFAQVIAQQKKSCIT